jgi:excinuclease ABC subunit C
VVRQGSEACVQLFFVRKGRLLGRESFFFERVAGSSDGEILSAFIRQFYAKNVVPPPEILLSETPPEIDLTGEWLVQRRGSRVELLAPQRGRKRDLVAMAEENAALALQTHLLARGSRQQVVLEDLERRSPCAARRIFIAPSASTSRRTRARDGRLHGGGRMAT